jgi:hypothetical protein
VSDILDAVPIDKYFELFKPNGGGDGGFIRVSLDYKKDLSEIPAPGGHANHACAWVHDTSCADSSSRTCNIRGCRTVPLLTAPLLTRQQQ